MIQVLKDEQNKAKVFYDKQSTALNEQCLHEKNEIKAVCLKIKLENFEFLIILFFLAI